VSPQLRKILVLLGSLLVGYIISVFLFAVADSISKMPSGKLWDESFRAPLRFILLIICFVVVLIPAFRSEEEPAVKTAAILTVGIFVVYIGFKISGIGHPDYPVTWALAHLEPMRQYLAGLASPR
jgi:hypothetical protein